MLNVELKRVFSQKLKIGNWLRVPVWWPRTLNRWSPPWRLIPYFPHSCKRNSAEINYLKLVVVIDWELLLDPWALNRWNPCKKLPICYTQKYTITLLLQLHPSNAEIVYIINYGKYSIACRFWITMKFWI